MSMCNLIEYNGNYSKTSGILLQYCRDKRAVNDDGEITNFTEASATDLVGLKNKQAKQATMVQKMLK